MTPHREMPIFTPPRLKTRPADRQGTTPIPEGALQAEPVPPLRKLSPAELRALEDLLVTVRDGLAEAGQADAHCEGTAAHDAARARPRWFA